MPSEEPSRLKATLKLQVSPLIRPLFTVTFSGKLTVSAPGVGFSTCTKPWADMAAVMASGVVGMFASSVMEDGARHEGTVQAATTDYVSMANANGFSDMWMLPCEHRFCDKPSATAACDWWRNRR